MKSWKLICKIKKRYRKVYLLSHHCSPEVLAYNFLNHCRVTPRVPLSHNQGHLCVFELLYFQSMQHTNPTFNMYFHPPFNFAFPNRMGGGDTNLQSHMCLHLHFAWCRRGAGYRKVVTYYINSYRKQFYEEIPEDKILSDIFSRNWGRSELHFLTHVFRF